MKLEAVRKSILLIGSILFMLLIGFQNCSKKTTTADLSSDPESASGVVISSGTGGSTTSNGSIDPATRALCFSKPIYWNNRDHSNSLFSYVGATATPKEYASCIDNKFVVDYTLADAKNSVCWQQEVTVVENTKPEIAFNPLNLGHLGTYRIREFGISTITELQFRIIPIDCKSPNLTRLPDSLCNNHTIQAADFTTKPAENTVTNLDIQPTIDANGGRQENTSLRFFKGCTEYLSQYTNQTTIPISSFAPGLYFYTWLNNAGDLKVSSLGVLE